MSKKPDACQKCKKKTTKLEKHRKKPGMKGGKYKDDNIQWLCHECHEKTTSNRGEFEFGGDKKQRNLKKNEGEKGFKEYQENAGHQRQEKMRKELGEKAYSNKQRENVMKRWKKKKSSNDSDIVKTAQQQNVANSFQNVEATLRDMLSFAEQKSQITSSPAADDWNIVATDVNSLLVGVERALVDLSEAMRIDAEFVQNQSTGEKVNVVQNAPGTVASGWKDGFINQFAQNYEGEQDGGDKIVSKARDIEQQINQLSFDVINHMSKTHLKGNRDLYDGRRSWWGKVSDDVTKAHRDIGFAHDAAQSAHSIDKGEL